MFLGSETIKKLIKEVNLISGYIDLDKQLQPNGFDLTVNSIYSLDSVGFIMKDAKILPSTTKIELNEEGNWNLPKGCYQIMFNETVNLGKNLAAISIQRSTVMRSGCTVNVGSWDAGYCGRGINLLTVSNELGFIIQKDARIVQLHFTPVIGDNFSYNGNYQGENKK